MKNLTKIFMAVAVAMFAFSCVTDTTEDLGIEVGKGGGNTQITLSLEESRTQLGEKADGLYPVYWSEGDAIAVNGAISAPLAAEAAGQPSATFQISGDVAYPYCVVYPAPEAVAIEDETTEEEPTPEPTPEPSLPENTYPVTFANVQPYTVGTFAPKSAPMYAYTVEAAEGEEQLPIQMQHLSGALRLAVKGDITLASMTVAAEGKIAGTFLIDCKTGKLTAHEEAVNNITVTLPEGGLKLNADVATPIYVAVPAGEHGIYTITLVSDALVDNTMVVRFNSDFHPVVPGVVKEFGEVTFTPNATSGEEGELVIVNAAQMKRLAQLSEVGQLSNVTKVTVGAIIDMSDVAWTGINILPSHITFDGGADKGYEIKGLKAPLFNSTAATIQNLKLTDVAIVETEQPIVGAIARSFYGTMTNCEASGTLTVNNTTFTTTASMSSYTVINIGGLVGQAGNATFENCENRVAVTVKAVCGEEVTPYIAVGGVVGGAHSGVSLTEIKNHGSVTIDTGEKSLRVRVGGILGNMIKYSEDYKTAPDVKVITKCENHGVISTTNIKSGITVSNFAGITGNLLQGVSFSDNHNHAAITCNDDGGSRYIGGIIGGANFSPISNCTNNAPLTNNGATGATRIGGIIANDVLCNVDNCINNVEGTIKNSGAITGTNNLYAGGIAAGDLYITNDNYKDYELDATACNITNCKNYADVIHDGACNSIFLAGINARCMSGAISNTTNSGAIKHIGNSKGNLMVAGINAHTCGPIDNCENTGAVMVGDGTNAPESAGDLIVCGIAWATTGSVTNCTNSGALTVDRDENGATEAVALRVAGIVGKPVGLLADCSNSGNITLSDLTANGNTVYIGGISCVTSVSAASSTADKWQNLVNSGDITLNNLGGWTSNTNCYIAGLIANQGYTSDALTTENRVVLYNCSNSGDITGTVIPGLASGTTGKDGRTIIAGCVAHYFAPLYDADNCDNNGKIEIETAAAGHSFIGGLAGYIAQGTKITESLCTIQNCDNTKPIIITAKKGELVTSAPAGEGHLIGGIFGGFYFATEKVKHDMEYKSLTNSATITLQGDNLSASAGRHCVAGISADNYCYGTYTNCHNSGAITVDGSLNGTGKDDAKNVMVAGIIAYAHSHDKAASERTPDSSLYYCTNTGAVTVKNLTMTDYMCVGGVAGYIAEAKVKTVISNCGNSGAVTVENVSCASGKTFNVAGFVGAYQETNTTFSGENVNIGNVIVKKCTSDSAKSRVGGFVGNTTEPIVGAKSYCGIWVPDTFKNNVGWIMGIARATATLASNCGVGGMVITGKEEITEEDGNGEVEVIGYKYNGTAITESDYLSKVYAGATAAASASEASFLTEKPALPTYTPAQ